MYLSEAPECAASVAVILKGKEEEGALHPRRGLWIHVNLITNHHKKTETRVTIPAAKRAKESYDLELPS